MGDINLTIPLIVTAPVTKVTNYSWSITPDGITVNLNYYAEDGKTIVQQETFYITGANWIPLQNAIITANVVGQKYLDVIEKAIRTKVLALKGWTGTIL